MPNQKVLITGSEGFVGPHLWRELEANGYDVLGTTLNIPESGLPKNTFQCDLLNQGQVDQLISDLKPDQVYHLAGWSNVGKSFSYPQKTFEVNVIATINLLEAVKKIEDYRPKILAVGSALEFGSIDPTNLPIDENTSFNPNSPYGVSKVANWYVCQQYYKVFHLPIFYAIPFNHTGPGQSPDFLAPYIAHEIAKIEAQSTKPVILTGNLSSKKDLLDVRDIVRAYRLLLEKGIAGEKYIISSGKSVSMQEVVNQLISKSKVAITTAIDPERIRPSETPDLFGDSKKLIDATGWTPEYTLEQTLSDLLDWYRIKVQ